MLAGGGYFEFGDLRVELPGRHVIVEVESGGGITNLAKYWYLLHENLITKPVTLLHLFRQVSTKDYESHIALWRFLGVKMIEELGGRVEDSSFPISDWKSAGWT